MFSRHHTFTARFKVLVLLLFLFSPVHILTAQDTNFAKADSLALSIPDSLSSGTDDMATYLNRYKLTDLEKARAAFRWITSEISYDIDAFMANWPAAAPASSVLKNKYAMCWGYANLFAELLDSLGIENHIIKGYAKGIGFDWSNPQLNEQAKHAWNAFKTDGQWHLADATFGTGNIDSNTNKFEKHFKPEYFDSSPEFLIYSHYPSKKKWQLLEDSISKKEFLKLTRVTANFEKFGLQFPDYQEKQVKTTEESTYTIYKPENVQLSAALIPSRHSLSKYIVHLDDSFSRIYQNLLNISIQNKVRKTKISMLFHEKRLYTLYIFARHKENQDTAFKLATIIDFKSSASVSKERLLK